MKNTQDKLEIIETEIKNKKKIIKKKIKELQLKKKDNHLLNKVIDIYNDIHHNILDEQKQQIYYFELLEKHLTHIIEYDLLNNTDKNSVEELKNAYQIKKEITNEKNKLL